MDTSTLPENFELNENFKETFHLIENTHENLYITGEAGTGKTTLLRYVRENSKKKFVVLAPTGIAAIQCKGQTIHSFFRFPPQFIQKENVKRLYGFEKLIKELDLLIIDEVSMLRADVMDAIDHSLRLNRRRENLPFGGVQVVFFGDLYQLPPIIPRELEELYEQFYKTPYFFSADVFESSHFKQIVLTKNYRQQDSDYLYLLNQIRSRSIDPHDLSVINEQVTNLLNVEGQVILTTRNQTASVINQKKLTDLSNKNFVFSAELSGDFERSACPTDYQLYLKVGARVMMLKNDPARRWVNGSIGEITYLDDQTVEVKINGETVKVEPTPWEKIKYSFDEEKQSIKEEVVGMFKQYPMKLAWAMTIHKSQGLTFDNIHVDLSGGAFAHGQVYVALSRCRSLKGLSLKRPVCISDLIFDERINEITRCFQTWRFQESFISDNML